MRYIVELTDAHLVKRYETVSADSIEDAKDRAIENAKRKSAITGRPTNKILATAVARIVDGKNDDAMILSIERSKTKGKAYLNLNYPDGNKETGLTSEIYASFATARRAAQRMGKRHSFTIVDNTKKK